MSATRLPWFRMYTDFLNDPKMIALAFEDQRHFIGILALKSDGAIDDICEESLLDRIVAQRLWIDHGVIRDVKKRLINAKLIDSAWQPLAWNKRQMQSDKDLTNAERQARYRESLKNKSTVSNALCNVTVTRIDTDTDTEEEKTVTAQAPKQTGFTLPAWIDKTNWDTWHSTPKRKKATALQKQAAVEKLAKWRDAGDDYATALENAAVGGYQGLFLPDNHGKTTTPAKQAVNGILAGAI